MESHEGARGDAATLGHRGVRRGASDMRVGDTAARLGRTGRPRARVRARFYAARRVPQVYAPAYVRLKLVPLLPAFVATAAVGLVAEIAQLPENWRDRAGRRAQAMGGDISQRSQRLFFDEPGLDTLLVRGLARIAKAGSTAGRTFLRVRTLLGDAREKSRAATMLPRMPRRGYEALMTSMLTMGTAVGILRGGGIHVRTIRDSAADPQVLKAPTGRPRAQLRRLDAPRSLGDMCADIDDMYWSMTTGQTLKITRVGRGDARRWILSLPGTAHMDFPTTANPADMEGNIREMLGLPSGIRIGVVAALHQAMRLDGIPDDRLAVEPVLICGHSQGGIVAVVLASMDPAEAGVNVRAILSMGAPGRRSRIRPDVVMLAVAHDQDVIPSMDGSPDQTPDHRVRVGRSLIRPRKDPLYYAHSSATYTETVRQLERKVDVAPYGRVAQTVHRLQEFLPKQGEATRVTFHEVWQDILEPTGADRFDTFLNLGIDASSEAVAEPAPISAAGADEEQLAGGTPDPGEEARR